MEEKRGRLVKQKDKLLLELISTKGKPFLLPIPANIPLKYENKECLANIDNNVIYDIKVEDEIVYAIRQVTPVQNAANVDQNTRITGQQNSINFRQRGRMPQDTAVTLSSSFIAYDNVNFNIRFNKLLELDFNSDKEEYKVINNVINTYHSIGYFDSLKWIVSRQLDIAKKTGYQYRDFSLKNNWRLIVGLGGEHVTETNMTLHHVYGIPYIPGQALKGITRSHIINEYYSSEEEALKDSAFRDLFGANEDEKEKYPAQAGKIIFYDAYPVEKPKISKDIMTPHYGKYYSEKQAPGDFYKPLPVSFFTVKDTAFQFIISVKKRYENELVKSENLGANEQPLLEMAEKYLLEALKSHGVGAKTAVGYGYFC